MSRGQTPRPATSAIKPRAPRADAARNRARIIKAARTLFEAQGADVEIDEVARRAGVGVGTIYRQFPNKDALIQGVLWSHVQPLVDAGHAKADAADPAAAFYEHLAFLAESFMSKEKVHLAVVRAGLAAAKRIPQNDAMAQSLETLLARAQAAGAVRTDISAVDLIMLIRSTLFPSYGGVVPKRVRRRLFDVVIRGLRP